MKGAAEVAGYFAENLRRLRKQANLSQEEVGLRSSLHRTEVGLLERGTRVPRIDTVLKLAAALDVPPKRLLAGISWTPGEIGEAKPGRFEHNLNPDPPQQDQPEDRKGKEPRGADDKDQARARRGCRQS
jgi:transcriptional regulator with XRE-family HTH domain